LTVTLPLGHVQAGAVMSLTVTSNEQLDDAPPLLKAVHVTDVVVPRSNELPDCGSHTMEVMVPPAVAAYVVVAVGTPVVGVIVLLVGHEIVGGVAALTVTVNEQLVVLDAKSRALHVTAVEPIGKVVPDGYVQLAVRKPDASDAVKVHVAAAPLPEVG
jgi:hypothetical protein